MRLLIIVGTVHWVLGYCATRFDFQPPDSQSRLLHVPGWLFLLCGYPKARQYPSNVLLLFTLWIQVSSLLTFVYAFFKYLGWFSLEPFTEAILAIYGPLLITLPFVWLIYIKWKYQP